MSVAAQSPFLVTLLCAGAAIETALYSPAFVGNRVPDHAILKRDFLCVNRSAAFNVLRSKRYLCQR